MWSGCNWEVPFLVKHPPLQRVAREMCLRIVHSLLGAADRSHDRQHMMPMKPLLATAFSGFL